MDSYFGIKLSKTVKNVLLMGLFSLFTSQDMN